MYVFEYAADTAFKVFVLILLCNQLMAAVFSPPYLLNTTKYKYQLLLFAFIVVNASMHF